MPFSCCKANPVKAHKPALSSANWLVSETSLVSSCTFEHAKLGIKVSPKIPRIFVMERVENSVKEENFNS